MKKNIVNLTKAVYKLADYAQRRMVDWHREISAMAEKRPCEINEEEKGQIDYAFEDETRSKFFTKSALHPEWIEWLDARGHLLRLFESGELRESDKILSQWLTYVRIRTL